MLTAVPIGIQASYKSLGMEELLKKSFVNSLSIFIREFIEILFFLKHFS